MTRKFNFGAGPATIPTSVLEEVKEELLDWRGRGLSVMEISHRSDFYQEIALEAERDFRDLLGVPESYSVLFTHGGATLQNSAIPLNLSSSEGEASYINSGRNNIADGFLTKNRFSLVMDNGNTKCCGPNHVSL